MRKNHKRESIYLFLVIAILIIPNLTALKKASYQSSSYTCTAPSGEAGIKIAGGGNSHSKFF